MKKGVGGGNLKKNINNFVFTREGEFLFFRP